PQAAPPRDRRGRPPSPAPRPTAQLGGPGVRRGPPRRVRPDPRRHPRGGQGPPPPGRRHLHPLARLRRAETELQKKVARAAEQDRPDVSEQRRVFRAAQAHLDPSRLVFIDETAATTNMTRRYGRCPVGERLVDPTPFGHWKVTTFVSALRHDRLTAA